MLQYEKGSTGFTQFGFVFINLLFDLDKGVDTVRNKRLLKLEEPNLVWVAWMPIVQYS